MGATSILGTLINTYSIQCGIAGFHTGFYIGGGAVIYASLKHKLSGGSGACPVENFHIL